MLVQRAFLFKGSSLLEQSSATPVSSHSLAPPQAADVADVKRNVDKTQEKLDTVLRALDRLQASVDVHTRGELRSCAQAPVSPRLS
jgi:hypothetical protein